MILPEARLPRWWMLTMRSSSRRLKPNASAARAPSVARPLPQALRANLLSFAATRLRHVGHSPNLERYDPDSWTDEFAFLSRPGQIDIQTELFYDYRTNVERYPEWQQYLRKHQPPILVLWGKYDPSFAVAGADAYRRDVPDAQIHLLEGGHFVLDEACDEAALLMRRFLGAKLKGGHGQTDTSLA